MELRGSTEDECGPLELLSLDELECKICYCAYNLGGRRPKVLECRHRLCAKCLVKILDLGESPAGALVCPFCRSLTRLAGSGQSQGQGQGQSQSQGQGQGLGGLPDDCNMLAALALRSRNQRNLSFHQDSCPELVLSPRRLTSLMASAPSAAVAVAASPSPSSSSSYSSIRGSRNFVVITIMEPPPSSAVAAAAASPELGGHPAAFRSSSLDSMASITQRWTVWNCAALLCQTSARALVWVLGLLYFSSLPMGVYLLIMQRTTAGVLLVSLLPASLLLIMLYGFCQCICHEFWDCMPP